MFHGQSWLTLRVFCQNVKVLCESLLVLSISIRDKKKYVRTSPPPLSMSGQSTRYQINFGTVRKPLDFTVSATNLDNKNYTSIIWFKISHFFFNNLQFNLNFQKALIESRDAVGIKSRIKNQERLMYEYSRDILPDIFIMICMDILSSCESNSRNSRPWSLSKYISQLV